VQIYADWRAQKLRSRSAAAHSGLRAVDASNYRAMPAILRRPTVGPGRLASVASVSGQRIVAANRRIVVKPSTSAAAQTPTLSYGPHVSRARDSRRDAVDLHRRLYRRSVFRRRIVCADMVRRADMSSAGSRVL